MTTGKSTLVIRWPSGQSIICGEMTDHQHGEICRILSPDYRAQLPNQGGEAVEVVASRDYEQLHATNQRLEGELESLGIEYVTALHGVTELRAEITELENDYKEAAADGMGAARQIHRLEGEVKRLREALEHARLFIRNGIDLGCIRMPDADTPDPAHHTLPMIDAALSTNVEVE